MSKSTPKISAAEPAPESKTTFHAVRQKRNMAPEFNAYTRTGQEWLAFGSNDLYPQQTVKLLNSATHNAIINTKASMAYGGGPAFQAIDAMAQDALNAACGGDCEPLLRRLLRDIVIHNGFALRVRYSMDYARIASLEYVDFKTIRIESPANNEDLMPHNCYISPDWAIITPNAKAYGPAQAVKEPLFNLKARGPEEPTQILYAIVPSDQTDYYPAPDYLGVINWALTEIEIANYHHKNVANSFRPDIILSMPDMMSEDDKEAFLATITDQYTGTDNAGGMIVLYAPLTPDTQGGASIAYPQITAMPNSANADLYLVTLTQATQQIITGHRLTSPAIAGLAGAGGLGGNASEIATSFE